MLDLETGWIGSHYRLGPEIGHGNQASVYLGIDVRTRERVAIKVINNGTCIAKVEHEISVLEKVDHPHIVRAFEVIQNDEYTCIVTEYFDGGELFDILARSKNFTEAQAAHVMRGIFSALSYLHSNGIVHRDLKPENILCVNKKWPLDIKIADFGLALVYDQQGSEIEARKMVGTPQYVAPEMLREEKYGSAVDMWASGVILFMLLSGRFPFFGESKEELLRKILSVEYTFREEQWDGISDSAKSLVKSLLQIDPEKRLTATAALYHPFLFSERRNPIGNDLSDMHSYRRQFRRVVSKAITVRRLQSGGQSSNQLD